MSVDLVLLETIKLWYPHPSRLFYERCWGCLKWRFFGERWEVYQMNEDPSHWGYLCSSCLVIVAGMVIDRLHNEIEQTQQFIIWGFTHMGDNPDRSLVLDHRAWRDAAIARFPFLVSGDS